MFGEPRSSILSEKYTCFEWRLFFPPLRIAPHINMCANYWTAERGASRTSTDRVGGPAQSGLGSADSVGLGPSQKAVSLRSTPPAVLRLSPPLTGVTWSLQLCHVHRRPTSFVSGRLRFSLVTRGPSRRYFAPSGVTQSLQSCRAVDASPTTRDRAAVKMAGSSSISLDTDRIREWRSIVTLIVFVLTSMILLPHRQMRSAVG